MELLGSRIKERLAAAGMSQAELARRIGVTQSAVNHLINRGYRKSGQLHRIARELGTTPEYLSGEIDDPAAPADLVPIPEPVRNTVSLEVVLPSETALAAMFETLLATIPEDASRAEAARILARRLPTGFAAIGPDAGPRHSAEVLEPGGPPPSHAKSHHGSERR
ncbi:helix-turn-helix transcriptional regulator [Novosphingobium mangrovi (ex Hu et al. 2023)]|uniref:helix-turn-helix transcriptional regulator n=1 Tax=Novosphingobium mangrovi (ex Hu et al. 2023) TaxID=2930094 RepID=UPI003AF30A37